MADYAQQVGEANRKISQANADIDALSKELEAAAKTKAAAEAMMAQTPSQTQKIEEVVVDIYEDGGKVQHNVNGVKIATLADKQKVQFPAAGDGYVVSGGAAKVTRDDKSDSVSKGGLKITLFKSSDRVVVYADDYRLQFYADGNCLITYNEENKWQGTIVKLQLCSNGTIISIDGDGKSEQLEKPAGFVSSRSAQNLAAAQELDNSIAQSFSIEEATFNSLLAKLTAEQEKAEQKLGAQEAKLASAEAEMAEAKALLKTSPESTADQDGVTINKYGGGAMSQHNQTGCVIVKLDAGRKVQLNADGSSLVVDTTVQTVTSLASGCRSIREQDGVKLCWYASGDRSMNEAHGPGKLQLCADGALILVEAGECLFQMMPDRQVIIVRDAAGGVKQYSADGMAVAAAGGGRAGGGAESNLAAGSVPAPAAGVAPAASSSEAGSASAVVATAVVAAVPVADAAALPVATPVNPNANLSHTIHFQMLEKAEKHLEENHEYAYGRAIDLLPSFRYVATTLTLVAIWL
jgi:hypothetical protein